MLQEDNQLNCHYEYQRSIYPNYQQHSMIRLILPAKPSSIYVNYFLSRIARQLLLRLVNQLRCPYCQLKTLNKSKMDRGEREWIGKV